MSNQTKLKLRIVYCLMAILGLSISNVFSQPNTWVQKANYGGGSVFSGVGFSIGDKGYIGLGDNGFGTQFQSIWEYDPSTDVWTQKADFGGGTRSNAVAFSIAGKAYVGTGYNTVSQQDFWEYDQALNTWTQKADFAGGPRIRMVGFAIGSKGYVGTGSDGTFRKDLWEYDPTTDTWTAKADFPGAARMSAAGFSIGSKGYLGTGWGASSNFKDFWEYDPATNIWLQKANVGTTNRYEAVGFSIGGKGYIGTGGEWPVYTKDLFEYDPVTDCWSKKADFGGAVRALASGFSVGGKGYIGTSNFQVDFWEYTPAISFPLPTFTSFDPPFGGVGTLITITGTNFSSTAANNTVTFNGITATISTSSANSITCTVPTGATTGSIKVEVGSSCNTATSPTNFIVPVCFPTDGQNADVVLGQTNFTTNTSGSGANKFNGAGLGIAIHFASGKVFIADQTNNRVLRFSSLAAATTGSSAEAVLGQPDFTTTTSGTTQTKMYAPTGLVIDQTSGTLWVAEYLNNRVTRFDNAISLTNGAPANGVLGQPNFTTNSASVVTATTLGGPTGVALDANGDLWTAERPWNRILKFANAATLSNGAAASVVLGQTTFNTNFAGTSQSTFNRTNGVAVDHLGNLWVADELNDRVLKFANAASLTTGANATVVLGQTNFFGNAFATAADRMYGPMTVHADIFGNLWVGDWANQRALQFANAASLSNGANASRVLGSPNFTTIAGGTAQNRTAVVWAIAVDNFGNVYVGDQGNNRILRFNAPVATSTSVSICTNTSATLTATGAVALQEYRWYDVPTGGSSISSASSFVTPSLSAPTTYYLSLFDAGCSYESARFPVTVTVNPLPPPPTATGAISCTSQPINLTAEGATDGQYRWYDGATLIAGEVNNTYTITNLTATKIYHVTIDDSTCESNKTPVTATIQNCNPPQVASSTATAFIEGTVTIDLKELITDEDNDIDPAQIQITMQPESGATASLSGFELTIDYTGFPFTGSDRVGIEACDLTNLCTAQEITIELGGDITVYNALSPNGDGKNEVFTIQYINILPETQSNKVFIYNRWGDEVFSMHDYNNNDRVFKGESNNGKKLAAGTYFYKIAFADGKKTLTGFLELKY